MPARMTADDIDRFLAAHFPQVRGFVTIDAIDAEHARLRLPYKDDFLRPGGTVSGPTLMTLADTAMYFLVLANLGPVVHTVTTSLHIDFLRRPAPRDLLAEARLLKLGKKLAVGTVLLHSDGDPHPVAHASVTYSVPGDRPDGQR